MKCPYCNKKLALKDVGYIQEVPREADIRIKDDGAIEHHNFTEYDEAISEGLICRLCYIRLLSGESYTEEKAAEIIHRVASGEAEEEECQED